MVKTILQLIAISWVGIIFPAYAQENSIQTGWTLGCNTQSTCILSNTSTSINKIPQSILDIYFSKKGLVLRATLPLGIDLSAPITLTLNENAILTLSPLSCQLYGCHAFTVLNADHISAFGLAQKSTLSFSIFETGQSLSSEHHGLGFSNNWVLLEKISQ